VTSAAARGLFRQDRSPGPGARDRDVFPAATGRRCADRELEAVLLQRSHGPEAAVNASGPCRHGVGLDRWDVGHFPAMSQARADEASDSTSLLVRRTDSVAHGYVGSYQVLIDGKLVGRVSRGDSITRVLEPGEHIVRVMREWHSSSDVPIALKDGDHLGIEFSPTETVDQFEDPGDGSFFTHRLLGAVTFTGESPRSRVTRTHQIIGLVVFLIGTLLLVGYGYESWSLFITIALTQLAVGRLFGPPRKRWRR
jgi:hypothetical protein